MTTGPWDPNAGTVTTTTTGTAGSTGSTGTTTGTTTTTTGTTSGTTGGATAGGVQYKCPTNFQLSQNAEGKYVCICPPPFTLNRETKTCQ